MKIRYSIKADIRQDKIKLNGNAPIYYFIMFNSVLIKIPTGKELNPKFWDTEKFKVIKCPLATELNRYFSNKAEQFHKFMMKNEMMGKEVNREAIKDYFNGTSDMTFYEFYHQQMDTWKGVKAESTIMYYKVVLKALKKYRSVLNFNDINLQLVEDFDKYLRLKQNNTDGGVFNKHKCFKAVIRSAIKRGLMDADPYKHFSIKSSEGKRLFLTSPELKKIMKLKIPSSKNYLNKIRDLFVFSCYSGLRFSDMEKLRWENIVDDAIVLKMQKTNKEVTVPLIPQTKSLLKKYREADLDDGKVFPTISNQKTNDYLKLIMGMVKINKKISFHCARHTNATLHISAGTNMLNLRDLLGHGDISTTQIYTKSMSTDLVKSMNCLSRL